MHFNLTVGGSTEAASARRGAGHHGGSSRKSLYRHLWRDGKWKDNSSASVSVWSRLCNVSSPLYAPVYKEFSGYLRRKIVHVLINTRLRVIRCCHHLCILFQQWKWYHRYHRAKKSCCCQHVTQSGQRNEPVHTVRNILSKGI